MELTVCQGVVTNVVAGRVGEDEEDGGDGGRASLVRQELLHRDRPSNVTAQQCHRAGQVHDTTGKSANEHGDGDGVDEGPGVKTDIELALEFGVGVANQLKQGAEIVRDKGVARPLGEETQEGADNDTTAQSSSGNHLEPGTRGLVQFDLDGALDLSHLGFDELRVAVAFGMVFDEHLKSFVSPVLADQETGRFWQEARTVSEEAFSKTRAQLTRRKRSG